MFSKLPEGAIGRRTSERWQRQFSDLIEAAGLYHAEPSQNVTIHTLRHTFGSWLALKGRSASAHSIPDGAQPITTTERYAHLLDEEAYEDTRALEKCRALFY